MLKIHNLFYLTDHEETFHSQIMPTQDQKTFLVKCKNEITEYLKPRIKNATKEILGMEKAVEPRFRTQGSWAYKTCINPAHLPPQEIDWDYGIYLPIHVWEDNGPPHAMAKLYFELVESLLKELCSQKKWSLISGKNTCIRIQVDKWGHIDIPLYAAPEDQFKQVVEKTASFESASDQKYLMEDSTNSINFGEIPLQVWEDLTDVVMATRTGEWKPSDPEAVAIWFKDKVSEHGTQLERICRYLKAWRDFHWDKGGGPTSISIMIAITQKFKSHHGRDDLALKNAALDLSLSIAGELYEPAIDQGKEDFNRLEGPERNDASKKAKELYTAIHDLMSFQENNKHLVINNLRSHFGERIPHRTDWIQIDSSAESIRVQPAHKVSPPVIPATHAG